jgi:hypothetical protein
MGLNGLPGTVAVIGFIKLFLVTVPPGVAVAYTLNSVASFLIENLGIVLRAALDVDGAETAATIIKWVCEVLAGMYLADIVSGCAHLFLDYELVGDDELRWHTEYSIPAVSEFEATSELFQKADPWDKFIWDFQVHHDAIYPAMKSEFMLCVEIFVISSVVYMPCCVAIYYGQVETGLAHILLLGWVFGAFIQKTHFDAHARNRDLYVNPVVRVLQDMGFLLSAAEHRKHHTEYDCNFCIFNGWANPVINRLAKALVAMGVLHFEPPTIQTRRERESVDLLSKTDAHDESSVCFKQLTEAVTLPLTTQ